MKKIIFNNVEFNIVEESSTRKVYFNDELIAKIVDRDIILDLHYIENGRDIGGDECDTLEECFETLIDYYNLDNAGCYLIFD